MNTASAQNSGLCDCYAKNIFGPFSPGPICDTVQNEKNGVYGNCLHDAGCHPARLKHIANKGEQ